MMRLLVATTNQNKIREIRPLLADLPVELLTLVDVAAIAEPEESARTYWENARIKAFAYAAAFPATAHASTDPSIETSHGNAIVVAEDSGLEIEGLDGAPGVQSARFLGADVPYRQRFAEIYRRLAHVPPAGRRARFVTALTAVRGGEVIFETEAAVHGVITPNPAGEHGFGYDPIFFYPPLRKTTAELTIDEKCIVSHRARAFRDFARWLRHSQLT
jgi:XTP/dITP diphosphohydrolase